MVRNIVRKMNLRGILIRGVPMPALKVSEDLRPLTEMKSHPNDVVRQAQESGRPVVLTRYGRGVAVLLSVDAYEELEGAAARARLVSGIREAEAAVERGDVVGDDDMNALMDSWDAEDA
jgi:prevent-host-death family protein